MDPRRHFRRLTAAGVVACLSIALGTTAAFGGFSSSVGATTAASSNSIVLPTPTISLSCSGNGRAKLSIVWSWPSMADTTSSTAGFLNAYTVAITVDGSQRQSGTNQSSYTDNSVPATPDKNHSASVTVAVTSSTSWSATASQSSSVSC
ncbi:hypothetical protein [Oryzihumus leptocrescens]|uniref:Ig-like domain-containing protein n=1 Tax=Oryzihumus leptocrescens TaxID=297536 RepID=A0A542Z7L1_9MICO|nr:hypothetical protein [Oryzihumus leptocrescens]TQL56323.1 hypothetical protein FB474_3939 [Oryzihumus leptocrescens]